MFASVTNAFTGNVMFELLSPAESVVVFMFLNMSVSSRKLFKLPLEKEGQVGGPILAQEEIKTIFGSIPDIYDVHTRIKVSAV